LAFSVSVGSLPAGLSLNTGTGAITGQPTTARSSTFTIRVQDPAGQFATKQFTVTIAALPSITTTTLSNWDAGVAGYSQTVATSGGSTPLAFSVSVGSLRAGLALNAGTGAITGQPTTAGSTTFTI